MALKTILIAGGAALVVASFIPFTFPGSAHVERSAVITAEPEQLYSLIASNKGYQSFNPYKSTDPDLRIELKGPEHGVGSGFAFDGKDGKGTQFVASVVENRKVHMKIDLGAMGQPTQTFDLKPVDGGTKVTWSMDMEFGWNPIGRVMGLFMDGMMGKTFEKGLANLSSAVDQAA